MIKGRCTICNNPTTHHHYYCDYHYPIENRLKYQIKKLKLRVRELEIKVKRQRQSILSLRLDNRKLKKVIGERQ